MTLGLFYGRPVKFTSKGKIQLYRGSDLISNHVVAEEAYERAYAHAIANGPGKYTVKYPDREIDLSKLERVVLLPSPAGTVATPISTSRIDLSWTPVFGAASYRVYRNGVLTGSPTSPASSQINLAASTLYSFRVSTVAAGGMEGPQGSQFSATTLPAADITPPSTPAIAASTLSSGSIQITLVTPSTDPSGIALYVIERSLNGSSGWTEITGDANFPYAATGLSASTQYYFRCRSRDGAGNWSAWSAVVNATTQAGQQPGDLVHGEEFTVTGSGFGTKSASSQLIWDNCSHGQALNSRWSGWWPDAGGGSYNMAYRTPTALGLSVPLPHSNVTHYLCGIHYPGSGFNAGYNVAAWRNITEASGNYLYHSWYERNSPSWVFNLGSPSDNNHKTWGYSVAGSIYELPNNWYIEHGIDAGSRYNSASTPNQSYFHTNDDAGGTGLSLASNFGDTAGSPWMGWRKIEVLVYLHASSGFVRVYDNGVERFNRAGRTIGYSGSSRSFGMGGYSRSYPNVNNARCFADIYADYSANPGRFYLTNHATFGSSTILELQPWVPNGWESGEVDLTCNKGALSSGTVHLHFRNEAGSSQYIGPRTIS